MKADFPAAPAETLTQYLCNGGPGTNFEMFL